MADAPLPPAPEATPATGQQQQSADSDESITWEGTDEYFNQELADSIDKRLAAEPSAPFRTDQEAPAFTEDNRYIPLVSQPKEGDVKGTGSKSDEQEKLPFDEEPMSEMAYKNMNMLLNILTKGSSRLVVRHLRGGTKTDLSIYTHKFHLVKDNTWELLECLAPLRRGDVWRCCTVGDVLYHIPFAHGNLFHDPLQRAKLVEQEAAEKVSVMHLINKNRNKIATQLRVAECERAISEFGQALKQCTEQRDAIQMLLQLHTHEKFNHEMVNYLRDNLGKMNKQLASVVEQNNRLQLELTEQKAHIKKLEEILLFAGVRSRLSLCEQEADEHVNLQVQPIDPVPLAPLKEN